MHQAWKINDISEKNIVTFNAKWKAFISFETRAMKRLIFFSSSLKLSVNIPKEREREKKHTNQTTRAIKKRVKTMRRITKDNSLAHIL